MGKHLGRSGLKLAVPGKTARKANAKTPPAKSSGARTGPNVVARLAIPDRSASEPAEGYGLQIGAQLKEIRKKKHVTLDALAKQVGFTKGYLSKLETGSKVPPIATLARIAHALHVDITSLLQQPNEPAPTVDATEVSVVRADQRPRIIRGGSTFGYDYQGLTQGNVKSGRMQPFIFSFPSQLLREVYFEHEGEELMFVLSGKVEIEIGKKRYQLLPGDCIHFQAFVRHRACGMDGEAKALVVILDEPDAQRG
jgi:transcriptional regulator with XRE-family HTH domain